MPDKAWYDTDTEEADTNAAPPKAPLSQAAFAGGYPAGPAAPVARLTVSGQPHGLPAPDHPPAPARIETAANAGRQPGYGGSGAVARRQNHTDGSAIHVVDAVTGAEKWHWERQDDPDWFLLCLTSSPNSKTLVGRGDNTMQVWDTSSLP